MGIVFLFLILLVYCVKLSGRILVKQTERELTELKTMAKSNLKARKEATSFLEDERSVAAISAAIQAHHTHMQE